MTDESNPLSDQDKHIPWHKFLPETPPNNVVRVTGVTETIYSNGFIINRVDIYDYCDNEICSGMRLFYLIEVPVNMNAKGNFLIRPHETKTEILVYRCRNCQERVRTYIIEFLKESGGVFELNKVAQQPPYGPLVPAKAISLVGPDRELFLKGRRAENQGLGIAAFAYYRRIIENQWQRFLNEISKVGSKTGLDPAIQQHIENAKKERQFDKAVKSMGEAIPPALKLNGQNPISLLYSALSEGIHAQSDEECLELAGHIRVILYELAERLNTALQEHNELDAAVKRLANRKSAILKPEE